MLKRATRVQRIMLFLMLVLLASFSACTKKDNLTGDNWSGISPITIIDSTFTDGYSYPVEGSVKGTEPVLLCANYMQKQAYTVIRFTGMPDPANLDTVGNATLKIVALRRSPFARGSISVDVFKLNQNWVADSTAVIDNANIALTALNTSPIMVPDTLATAGDTLSITIPANDIRNWKTEDITGFNVVIRTQSDGFVEFRSIESGNGPLLTFEYKLNGESNDRTYNMRAIMDSYKVEAPAFEILPSAWKLQNISPSRLYMKFALDEGKFVDNSGNTLSALQLKRVTINKAEIVLYIKDNPYYNAISYSILANNVLRDSITVPISLTNNESELIAFTPTSTGIISGDSLRINITPIVQAITSQDRPNRGLILRSLHEMINLGELEFWHFMDAALPAGKEPKLIITYTPPYL